MKKYTKTQKILSAVLVVVLALTVFLNVIKDSAVYQSVNAHVYSFVSSVRYALFDYPARSISMFAADVSQFYKLQEENDLLRSQISSIEAIQAQNTEYARTIAELKAQLELNSAYPQYTITHATVLNRDLSTWSNVITVDKGSADGLDPNRQYAVITSTKAVIGKIQSVGEHSSLVTLLTSKETMNQVAVQIQLENQGTAQAILESYDANTGSYVLSLISSNASIKQGMVVVTSGLGGVYPSGLLVGKVSEIQQGTDANSVRIYVLPSADYNSFDYVGIVAAGQS